MRINVYTCILYYTNTNRERERERDIYMHTYIHGGGGVCVHVCVCVRERERERERKRPAAVRSLVVFRTVGNSMYVAFVRTHSASKNLHVRLV